MAIDFPNSPSVNDTYVVDGRTWIWTGSVWNIIGQGGPTGPIGPTGPTGNIGPTGPAGIINTDNNPGKQIYIGSIDPDISYTPGIGDVWIKV